MDKAYGKVIHQQALSIMEKGNEVKVVSPIPFIPYWLKKRSSRFYNYYATKEIEFHDGIEVHYPKYLSIKRYPSLFSFSSLFMFNSVFEKVKKLKESFDFEIIHVHFGYPDAFVAMKLAKILNVKLIITYQSTDLDKTYPMSNTLKKKINKAFYESDKIISPSPRLSRKLSELMDLKSYHIGYGIDLEKVTVNNKFNFKSNPTMISVSRLVESKGINYNIEAISILHKNNINVKYIVVGDGPEKEKLINLASRLGVSKYVIFTGSLSHEDAIKQIASADIFSLPSWQETFGLVYLEAMANYKPVIGCKGQGFDGIIIDRNNGFLAEPKSAESISNIVQFILGNNTDLERIVSSARQTVESTYTFEKIANKLSKLYED